MSVSEPESGIHSLWRLKTNTYRTACGTSEQLASGTLNGRFREGSPGRTVKKSAITGAVLGPNWLRTESGCPLIAVKQLACSSQLRLMPEGKVFGIAVEKAVYTNVLTTVIPEFSTIAIPVAIFVMLFFIRRRRA